MYANYVMTGSISPRCVSMSLLLMRIFPEDSPVSEKILRLYKRMNTEILPSEQLHRAYSLSNIAIKVFDIVFNKDQLLYNHIQTKLNHEEKELPRMNGGEQSVPSSTGSSSSASGAIGDLGSLGVPPVAAAIGGTNASATQSNLSNMSITDKRSLLKLHQSKSDLTATSGNATGADSAKQPYFTQDSSPPSLILLRGWLETGFVGWFNPSSVLYIWDVLLCFGWEPNHGIYYMRQLNLDSATERTSNVSKATNMNSRFDGVSSKETDKQREIPAIFESILPSLCHVLLQVQYV